MDIVQNPDGRPRLLDLVDRAVGLRSLMEFNVVYSLADRECERCLNGRRENIGDSVALVKRHDRQHPEGHLVTLCAEHAEAWNTAQ